MTTVEQENTGNIRRLYEEYLNQNRRELLPSLVSEDVVLHRLRVAFPDMHFTLLDVIACDDRVVVRWTMDATHAGPLNGIPATDKRVQQRANVICRMDDGKIAEIWAQMDQVGMLRQLGIDPLAGLKTAVAK